jgi:AraC-like DNA-binding protein
MFNLGFSSDNLLYYQAMKEIKASELRREVPAGIDLPEGKVRVLESHHAANFEMERGVWPFHKICWVAVGRGSLESNAGCAPIARNDFLLLPADWSHRFVDNPREPLTLVILCISKSYLGVVASSQAAQLWCHALEAYPVGAPVCARSAFHLNALIEQFRLALREQNNRSMGWEIALAAVADQLLISLGRGYFEASAKHDNSNFQAVEDAIEYIRAQPYERLQIGDMAERCHLSPRRFTDLFKQQTGRTFSQYLNEERIRYACRRLDETGHILYACHESGFKDLEYFYRVFGKTMGMTPGQYLCLP